MNKKLMIGVMMLVLLMTTGNKANTQNNPEDVYRLYNEQTGQHFYTKSAKEARELMNINWKFEGSEWVTQKSENATAIFRLYNPNNGDHFYTKSAKELSELNIAGWRSEGEAFYESTNDIPVYRLYNPNTQISMHHYTTNSNENNKLETIGWKKEGIAWYGMSIEENTDKSELRKVLNQSNEVSEETLNNQLKKEFKNSKNTAVITEVSKTSTQKHIDMATEQLKEVLDKVQKQENTNENTQVNNNDKLTADKYLKAVNEQMFFKINEYRKSLNLPQFALDTRLDDYTKIRAREITEKFDHTRPNGKPFYTVLPKDKRSANEMLVGTYFFKNYMDKETAGESADLALSLLKNSPGHNAVLTQKHKIQNPWINIQSSYYDNDTIYIVIITEYNP